MRKPTQNKIRDFKDGAWYWLNKALIYHHAQRIRAIGLAVYNCLAALADRNQSCYPSIRYIAKTLGYSLPTIRKALKLLEREGLIEIHKERGKYCSFRLLSLKERKENCSQGKVSCSSKEKILPQNNNNLLKIKKTNNICDFKFFNPFASKRVIPKTREELLALDLAQGLSDQKNFGFYLNLARKYPESLLRQILGEVKEIPLSKIKKGRAALFNYLLKKYAKRTFEDSGN